MACQLSAGLGIKTPESCTPWEDCLPHQPALKLCIAPAPCVAVGQSRLRLHAALQLPEAPSPHRGAPPRAPPEARPPPSRGAPQRQPPLTAGTEAGWGPAARPVTWGPSFPRAKKARKEAFSSRVPLPYFLGAKTLP